MGTMSFSLPPALPLEMSRELELACLAGGFDNAPNPTRVRVQPELLTLQRGVDESGFLITPWQVEGVGRLMTTTSTLMERAEPYSLSIELARGKVNLVRNHVEECRSLGLSLPDALEELLQRLNRRFGQVMASAPSAQADQIAQEVLSEALQLIDQLLPQYAEELFRIRHQRFPRLDVALEVQIAAAPGPPEAVTQALNGIRLSLAWKAIEPSESAYNWSAPDAVLDWAEAAGLPVSAGPLIDFSAAGVPDWLWIWQGDLSNLANFMCDYVETAIHRYRNRVKRWFIATGCNVAGFLGLSEDDTLWLTARLTEAALQIAPEAEIVIGVAQPWGDYMAREEHTYTPVVFLDTLLRTGLKLSALDIELAMGIAPHGSYCRDLLEVSRLLDGYAALSTPMQVTLAVPSSTEDDPQANSELEVTWGAWQGGFSPAVQADRGVKLAALALSKPFVNGVCWSHLSDARPHRFPNCGLLDSEERPKSVLAALRQLREAHLR